MTKEQVLAALEIIALEIQTSLEIQMNLGFVSGRNYGWQVGVWVEPSTKFARVVRASDIVDNDKPRKASKDFSNPSVLCFVALEDGNTKGLGSYKAGAIIKGTYKAPVARGVRGHITDWKACISRDGHLNYLR